MLRRCGVVPHVSMLIFRVTGSNFKKYAQKFWLTKGERMRRA
jgi:hypothetical protein